MTIDLRLLTIHAPVAQLDRAAASEAVSTRSSRVRGSIKVQMFRSLCSGVRL